MSVIVIELVSVDGIGRTTSQRFADLWPNRSDDFYSRVKEEK